MTALRSFLAGIVLVAVTTTPVAAQSASDEASEDAPSDATNASPEDSEEGAAAAEDATDGADEAAEGAADDADEAAEGAEGEAVAGPVASVDDRRPIPDYDGRPVLLWVPRLLFYPLHLVTEYLIRRPLGLLVTRIEEEEIPAKLQDFFTFGPEREYALVPTFTFDFGLRPNIGLYFRANDFIARGNHLRASVAYGGRDFYHVAVADRIEPEGSPYSYGFKFDFTQRPDRPHFGIGQDIDDDDRARYQQVGTDITLHTAVDLWRQSSAQIELGHRWRTFNDDVSGFPSIEERVAQGRFELPPGYPDGYQVALQRTSITLDTRRDRPAPGHGFALSGAYELGLDLENGPSERLWITYGGAVSGFVDLSGAQHVLSLTLSAAFADALEGEVPFSELVSPSGDGPLGGFLPRYLVGESFAAASFDYHWPVWVWLDGVAHFTVGNVFDRHLKGFSVEDLRMSFGVGLAGVSTRDHFFEFLLGFGTDTFANGPSIESVRVYFGSRREF